jgi:hypothetical protein
MSSMPHDGSLILSDVGLAHSRAGIRGVRQARAIAWRGSWPSMATRS